MIKHLRRVGRLLPVILLCLSVSAWAQERKVSGKVTAADDGSGIPGVNVVEKGTTNGAVTDADGNYSISVRSNAILVFSAIGFATQEAAIGEQTVLNVTLATDVTSLSEVVVVGYGSQDKKEITGSAVSLSTEQFNKGNVNDPTQLLQGKVPGLSIYNKGGNPNSAATIRLRGISTVGSNSQPLIVVDGVLGADLANVDPNDIESVNVLKDGSAAAIYGSRGSSGVILVTTKRGSKQAVSLSYNGYVSAATIFKRISNMNASEYLAAGGNDLGSNTDWIDEVTRIGVSNVHNIAVSGGNETTSFRVSTNFRNVQGILQNSGFDQMNARANVTHRAINDKLKLDFNMALTNRENDFSFNEALRYAALYNPTAPIKFPNGEYFQAILFDNFNPVAILNQNINKGKTKTLNYSVKADYSLTKNITFTVNYARQFGNDFNGEYYSRNSLFRGFNRGGLARRATNDRDFTLFEGYGSYSSSFGKVNMDVTAGYSYQEDNSSGTFIEMGNFPNDQLGYNAIQMSADRVTGIPANINVSSYGNPASKIIAQFARLSLTYDNGIFFNASVRREGSTKLGANNRIGTFPAFGAGVDLNKYLNIAKVLKVRVGYGVTGSLPGSTGLSQDRYDYSFDGGGTIKIGLNGNPDLKWEQKAETNIGIDYGFGKISGTLDVYQRDVKDFILERDVDVTKYASGRRTENAGSLRTRGIELAINYNAVQLGDLRWTPGLNLTTYTTELKSFIINQQRQAEVGAPGQNGSYMTLVKVGEKIGQIWGPVFDHVSAGGSDGANQVQDPNDATKGVAAGGVVFRDLNGDGKINAGEGSSLAANGDFKTLGNGIPKLEIGWTNQLSYKNWDLNAFFRGAFGHSLVNGFRNFYEPIDLGAIKSYNRIITDKAVDGLTEAKFSSLYVEKAGFIKLDNVTLGYNLSTGSSKAFKSVRLYTTVQNVFQITKYTGIDPDPVLVDYGSADNGGFQGTTGNPLAPGIDRRNNYFTARTFTFGVTVNFK